jgi:cell division protein FtsN
MTTMTSSGSDTRVSTMMAVFAVAIVAIIGFAFYLFASGNLTAPVVTHETNRAVSEIPAPSMPAPSPAE